MMTTTTTASSLAVWSTLAAALLAVLASALTLFPSFLLFLSQSNLNVDNRTKLTSLEAFLSLHFGVYLAALVLTLILNVPSDSSHPIPSPEDSVPSQPLLTPLTIAAILSAFFAWNTKDVGALASIVFLINLVIGLWGLWTVVFANSSAISKTTGADKHTSAFLFGNKAAASSKKKALRKGE